MKCWQCENDARASCKFCGRFTCKDHSIEHPVFMAMYLGDQDIPKAVVVANAIWCGLCEPVQEPIPMPEMY